MLPFQTRSLLSLTRYLDLYLRPCVFHSAALSFKRKRVSFPFLPTAQFLDLWCIDRTGKWWALLACYLPLLLASDRAPTEGRRLGPHAVPRLAVCHPSGLQSTLGDKQRFKFLICIEDTISMPNPLH